MTLAGDWPDDLPNVFNPITVLGVENGIASGTIGNVAFTPLMNTQGVLVVASLVYPGAIPAAPICWISGTPPNSAGISQLGVISGPIAMNRVDSSGGVVGASLCYAASFPFGTSLTNCTATVDFLGGAGGTWNLAVYSSASIVAVPALNPLTSGVAGSYPGFGGQMFGAVIGDPVLGVGIPQVATAVADGNFAQNAVVLPAPQIGANYLFSCDARLNSSADSATLVDSLGSFAGWYCPVVNEFYGSGPFGPLRVTSAVIFSSENVAQNAEILLRYAPGP